MHINVVDGLNVYWFYMSGPLIDEINLICTQICMYILLGLGKLLANSQS